MNILCPLIIKPSANPFFKQRCLELINKLPEANAEHTFTTILDETPITEWTGPNTPWKKVTVARNQILATVDLTKYDYVLFIDTDVIDYPLDMPTRLIKANPDGVSAPWVIIEDSNRFYDCSAFILKGKANPNKQGWQPDFGINILNDPPFYPPEADPTPDNPILSLDCAGTITMVSADIYKYAKYENHPSYTDHYSICQSCRNLGRKVICDRSIIAVHANLPKYGESWH